MRRCAAVAIAMLAFAALAVLPTPDRPVEQVRQDYQIAASAPSVAPPPPVVGYRAPVEPVHVLRGFAPPPTPYGAGHRGVDLAVSPGQAVRAAGPGVVGFAGEVAGRGVVVIAHADGVSTEYEPLAPSVVAGQTLTAGEVIGRLAGSHDGCLPGACLHWGARRGGAYFDPLSLLRHLGPVRLLPWRPDG